MEGSCKDSYKGLLHSQLIFQRANEIGHWVRVWGEDNRFSLVRKDDKLLGDALFLK